MTRFRSDLNSFNWLLKVLIVFESITFFGILFHSSTILCEKLYFLTFVLQFFLLARMVLRNDASPSDGDNRRLVCVRGDQCHEHIKDIRKRVD